MKKLSKLLIDSDKIIKNEELITLRGGGYSQCWCSTTGWFTISPCDERLAKDYCQAHGGTFGGCSGCS